MAIKSSIMYHKLPFTDSLKSEDSALSIQRNRNYVYIRSATAVLFGFMISKKIKYISLSNIQLPILSI